MSELTYFDELESSSIKPRKASYFSNVHCDHHSGCNAKSEDYILIKGFQSSRPANWGMAGFYYSEPRDQFHFCPEHKNLYCIDDPHEQDDGCGERLGKYGQCINCDDMTDEEYEKEYADGFMPRKAGITEITYCDRCYKEGAHPDSWNENIQDGWRVPTKNEKRGFPVKNKKFDSWNHEKIFCPDCWKENDFCHNCGSQDLGKYNQCLRCYGKDEDYVEDYAKGFLPKKASHMSFAICDHPNCNKESEEKFYADDSVCPKDWGVAGLNNPDMEWWEDIFHFCPEHKNLHCIDNEAKNHTGCGYRLGEYGQCTNPDCEKFAGEDENYLEDYAKSFLPKKASYQVSVFCDHSNCNRESEEKFDSDESACPKGWGSVGIHNKDPMDHAHVCPEHKYIYCIDDHENYQDGCGNRLSEYGECSQPDCDNFVAFDEDYVKDYAKNFLPKKTSGYNISVYCDHPGCNAETEEKWDISEQPDPTGWGWLGMHHTGEFMENHEHFCKKHKNLYCLDDDNNENENEVYGCGELLGKYGQCTNPDCGRFAGEDENYLEDYAKGFMPKKAINYFSLDQPNEAIMPGMAQSEVSSGATIDDAYLDDGLELGSKPNPDSGMEDNVTQDFPGMHDYERGLSSAASRKQAYYEKVIRCDQCNRLTPTEDEYLPNNWGRACLDVNWPQSGPSDFDEEKHYCPDCRANRHLDENTNDPFKITFGCGTLLGKYGQCPVCEETDEEYEKNYANAFRKKAYMTVTCNGCGDSEYWDSINLENWANVDDPDNVHLCPTCKTTHCHGCGELLESPKNNNCSYCTFCHRMNHDLGTYGQCIDKEGEDEEYLKNYADSFKKKASYQISCDNCKNAEEIPYIGPAFKHFVEKGWGGVDDDQGPHFCPVCMKNTCPDCFWPLKNGMCENCD
jgi:hypothetical protein